MWETSPDVDKKCAVRSYLLTALERSGGLPACAVHADRSHNSNVPLVTDLNVTIQMRVTIIDTPKPPAGLKPVSIFRQD